MKNRILMLLENNAYPKDSRVRKEANTLVEAGYQVTVIAPTFDNQKRVENVNGVTVYRYKGAPNLGGVLGYLVEYGHSFIMAFFYAWWIYLRHGFDVIHSHNPPEIYVFVAIFFKPFGVKFLFDHHDLSPEVYMARTNDEGSKLLHRVLLWMERVTLRQANHVIATNQSYRKIQIERGRVSPENITIVRNGPRLDVFVPPEPIPEIRAKADHILAYAGIMGVQDGIDYLIKALAHLRHELGRTDFYCLLIGEGNQRHYLEQLAREQKVAEHIRFTGWLSGEDYVRALGTAHICIDPDPISIYNNHSTMIKLTEYMGLAKPIVAFDMVEHRFTAQEAAVYVSENSPALMAEAIAALMDDPERQKQMGQFGRQRVENALAWRYSAENLLSAYNKLLPIAQKEPEKSPQPAEAKADLPQETT